MIINPNKNQEAQSKIERARRQAVKKTYMQKQYERAEQEADKIKNHNEKILREKGYYNAE